MPLAAGTLADGVIDGPAQGIALTTAARTATTVSEAFSPGQHSIVEASLYASALAATPSITLSLQVWDEGSQTWDTVITSAAIATASPTRVAVQVNPHTPAVTNFSTQRVVTPKMRVSVAHSDADSITYSVSVRAS
jgi:hypothetical protein